MKSDSKSETIAGRMEHIKLLALSENKNRKRERKT